MENQKVKPSSLSKVFMLLIWNSQVCISSQSCSQRPSPCSCSWHFSFWFPRMFISLKPEGRKSPIVEDNARKSLANQKALGVCSQRGHVRAGPLLRRAPSSNRAWRKPPGSGPLGCCVQAVWARLVCIVPPCPAHCSEHSWVPFLGLCLAGCAFVL